ncbi:hypothetical protein K0M31_016760 [Melipona bicolor]|uniref:Uncharacterized protein n=1 Tax=Melipona bicolor TaxID=60889 RepID=A0AA40FEA1_9HYME|nr:hypothetical protein K0M31_016760 [Melipona bicolor]
MPHDQEGHKGGRVLGREGDRIICKIVDERARKGKEAEKCNSDDATKDKKPKTLQKGCRY